ncbi:MAG: baseplate wedge protein 53 [Candidatus Poseidoniales archaeon]
MSEYFSYFPTTEHDLTNIGQTVTLTNVMRRFIVRNNLQERSDVFYKYDVQMGDRPDTIAEKYYGDADLAWLVLHFNDMVDPIFDFPLFGRDFDNYIRGKYGSVPAAKSEVHEYRQILQDAEVKFDGTKVPERYVVVDLTTYNTLSATARRTIYKYDWEEEKNEKKREIKLLDKRFTDKVRDEVETILRDGI